MWPSDANIAKAIRIHYAILVHMIKKHRSWHSKKDLVHMIKKHRRWHSNKDSNLAQTDNHREISKTRTHTKQNTKMIKSHTRIRTNT